MTNFQLALAVLSAGLLPIAIYSIAHGSQLQKNLWAAPYYEAEKYLCLFGNLFLVTIAVSGIERLAAHYNLVDPATQTSIRDLLGVPFVVVRVGYLALWFRAWRKVQARAA